MKLTFVVISVLALSSVAAHAQSTKTTTDCNVYGQNISCDSTSTVQSTPQSSQAGQAIGAPIGTALGTAIGNSILHHRVKGYCKKHPGVDVTLNGNLVGHCNLDGTVAR